MRICPTRFNNALLLALLALAGCGQRGSPSAPELLVDEEIPITMLNSGKALIVEPRSRGFRLLEVSQEYANVRVRVMDSTTEAREFDAPARRAAGAERVCLFGNAAPLQLVLSTQDRVGDAGKSVRVRITTIAAKSRANAPIEIEAECLETQGALDHATWQPGMASAQTAYYEQAAVLWQSLGNRPRAAAARLNAAWLATRRTEDWVAAARLGKLAYEAFTAAGDRIGMANATLQLAVPKWELLQNGRDATGQPVTDGAKLLNELGQELAAAVATYDAASLAYFSAEARNGTGYNYFLQGNYPQAMSEFTDAAERFRTLRDGDGATRLTNNMNMVLRSTGKYREAAAAFDRLLSADEHIASNEALADIYNNSAATHSAAGNYDRALVQFMQALSTHDRAADKGGIARSLNGVALTYLRLGNVAVALEYALKAEKAAKEDSNEFAESLLIAGEAQRLLGRAREAKETHRRALAASHSVPTQVDVNLELARDSLASGDLAAAKGFIATAQEIAAPLHRELSRLRVRLERARLSLANSDAKGAATEFAGLRGKFQALGAAGYEIEILHGLASAQFAQGQIATALASNQSSIDELNKLRLSIASPELRTRLTAIHRDAYELRVEMLLALRDGQRAVDKRERTLMQALQASDAAQAGLVGEHDRTREFAGPDPLLEARRQLAAEIAMHEHMLLGLQLGGDSPDNGASMKADLERLRAEYDSKETVQVVAPDVRKADYAAPDFRGDTAVIVYLRATSGIHRLVITREGVQERKLASPAAIEAANDAALLELENLLMTGSARNARYSALSALSRLLLDDTASIATKSRWIVVADSTTARSPFAALSDAASSYRPVIGTHDISMALTVRDALSLAQTADSDLRPDLSKVVLFFDPVFNPLDDRVHRDDKAAPGFVPMTRLVGSAIEASRITDAVGKARVLSFSGFGASRDALFGRRVRDAGILHFATHAVASDQWPYGSGLVLTGSTPKGALLNGYVSTLDLISHRLNINLVVLSACDTAVGEASSTENVSGLGRAFLAAGARRVVATRWKVPDIATAALMADFYARMAAGDTPARALSRAQAAMSTRGSSPDPGSWAGFVIYERRPTTD